MGKDGVHPGTAYTLVTPKQASFAGELAHHLEVSEEKGWMQIVFFFTAWMSFGGASSAMCWSEILSVPPEMLAGSTAVCNFFFAFCFVLLCFISFCFL